ncbi:Xylose isomerase-like TIM barrel [Caballeronia glebae]|uniref:Xylose isomerase-like TIM barrel n=1 Tax=Caballeronia glebae TaxID=1777143 RepID=A0A158A3D9_9BURK|nr:TIM barrel protein [Caballeronia glebae]SAK52332.1 Xylose isomerase-like TIM barrel [Caballeronia glebae]
MSEPARIKRGISLYSYQEEFFLRKLDLEGCIAEAAKIGANGIEIVSEQMIPRAPRASDAFYSQWTEWMDKYGTTPVCHDLFLDTKRDPDRLLTDDECVASIEADLCHAKRLGCRYVRVLVSVSPHILARCVSAAERYDVKMLLEVHSPLHFDHPWIIRHAESMEKLGTRHIGFLPDMGIFVKRYPRVMRDRFVRMGARESLADFISAAYDDRILSEYLLQDVRRMGGTPVELAMAETVRHTIWSSPRRLLEFMPRIHHIHAKFYEMTADEIEPSIPYDEIIPVLVAGGYQGYLSSEYEGNRHIQDAFEVDSVEQVRRQHSMFERLLEQYAPVAA